MVRSDLAHPSTRKGPRGRVVAVEFGFARREEIDRIVELLRDDPMGRTRESIDRAPYERAFDEIANDPNSFVIVGREEGEIISTVQLTVIPTMSRQGTKRGQLESVRVHRSRRGTGVGKATVLWTIDLARGKGCGVIQLTTDKERTEAISFYRTLGFQNTHEGLKLHVPPR